MRVTAVRIGIVASLVYAMMISGIWHTSSNTATQRFKQQPESGLQKSNALPARPLTYRSPGALHKVMVSAIDAPLASHLIATKAARKAKNYGAFTLLEISNETLSSLDSQRLEKIQIRDDMNLIMLRRGQIDTTANEPQIASDLREEKQSSHSLHLVQLFGPPTPDAIERIQATGAKLVTYIPNNAYLIYASESQLAGVRKLHSTDVIQWQGAFHPFYKLDAHIELNSVAERTFAIELVDAPETSNTLEKIKAVAKTVVMPETQIAGTIQMKIRAESYRMAELAKLSEVVFIEPTAKVRMHDERANQIIAGSVTEETINNIKVARPSNPGYLTFLNGLGFNANFDFAIDIADSGFDKGTPVNSHQDFLDAFGQSRVAYLHDFTNTQAANPTRDTDGHGTLNASIAAGFNVTGGSSFQDALGFQYGLGVAPFARIGVTKIFDDDGEFASRLSYAQYILDAYNGGARISNNSWGTCDLELGICNLYDSDARTFDLLARDVDTSTASYENMIIVFSAGNDGRKSSASVAMPATAKNVISVGASEGFRATDASGNPLTDGCGIGATLADNAQDVTDFSSGGPVQDGRAKPDLVAPGSHITGVVTQDSVYATKPIANIGVCDRYFPSGQTLYTWSSGTSHAAPSVAGGAALAFQWLKNRRGAEPSSALVKALLLNSTTYLTGKDANDNLPGAKQGWGLMNVARMFENVDRIIYDQDAHLFTQSGGTPFEISGVITDPTKEFRVMLTYTDAPGAALSNAPYVNQLNLEVTVGGVTFNGNVFAGQYSKSGGTKDFLNNAQGVRLPAGTTGTFVIRILPTVIAGDGALFNDISLDQDFALVVTNGRETPVPILSTATEVVNDVTLDDVSVIHNGGATDRALIPGETAEITLGVRNTSTVAATITAATLNFTGATTASAATFPVLAGNSTTRNDTPFTIQVPNNLRCGSIAELQLKLTTNLGVITLPFRAMVGRATSQMVLIDDDVDSARVRWKPKKGFSTATNVGLSGTQSYNAIDPGKIANDQILATLMMKKPVTIPENAGNVRLSFYHILDFEPGFDGGVMEYSLDDGVTWLDLGSRAIVGGYDGRVTSASTNPLGNRFAWTSRRRPGVFTQVVLNLDEFAGKRIRLRFAAGFDQATGILDGFRGWYIDNIKLTADSVECR
ncbi:MAG: S8 family serine peptidase [Acidobacteriota bacterium]